MRNNIRPGQLVYWRMQAAIVLELKGFTDVILRMVDGAKTEIVNVADLTTTLPLKNTGGNHLLLAKDKEWDKAVARFEMIRPLLDSSNRTMDDIQKVADTDLPPKFSSP